MICHAPEAAPIQVFPLAQAMIGPNLRVLLVAAVGPPPLLAPHPAAALIPAVDLPPIAGTADVKHHLATSAKQRQLCTLQISVLVWGDAQEGTVAEYLYLDYAPTVAGFEEDHKNWRRLGFLRCLEAHC